jgi:hypothetical protein
MEYAVIIVPAAPVRRKAKHQREMVNQLLFGEMVKIIKTKGDLWLKVSSLHDDYEGWLTKTMIAPVEEADAKATSEFAANELLSLISVNEKTMHIPLGSSLPGFINGVGKINNLNYNFSGNYIKRYDQQHNADFLNSCTGRWMNAPYMWGGRTILGVDCSGFVQVNYKMMGIDLPRDAWQQAQQGKSVKKLKDAQPGDLAFFNDKEEIVHVGILLNNEQIIHASGKVRIDAIDKKGIINTDIGKRTHSLMAIKRQW